MLLAMPTETQAQLDQPAGKQRLMGFGCATGEATVAGFSSA
jgi:hypothetical protein